MPDIKSFNISALNNMRNRSMDFKSTNTRRVPIEEDGYANDMTPATEFCVPARDGDKIPSFLKYDVVH
jgi:hypothetical protein